MKNISRRVFIKGLAVAGVAAAASTVLAGCNTNMLPDVDNGTEGEGETVTNSQVVTLDDGDKFEVKVTVGSPVYYESVKKLVVPVSVVNTSEEGTTSLADFTFATAAATNCATAKTVYVVPSLSFDGQPTNTATYESNNKLGGTILAQTDIYAPVYDGDLIFDVDAKYKDWKYFTLQLDVNSCKTAYAAPSTAAVFDTKSFTVKVDR